MCADFKRLCAYDKALAFSDLVYETTRDFPQRERKRLAASLRNASVMVAEKIAEGIGRHYLRDKRRSFSLARGAAYRCMPLVEIARRQGMLDTETACRLQEMCRILGGTIAVLIGAPVRKR